MTVPTDKQELQVDTLFVGLTRPTTKGGIPELAFIIEVVVTTLLFLAVGNPLYLLTAAPIHAVLYLLSAHDHNMFAAIDMWRRTCAHCPNARFWGEPSFSPLQTHRFAG